MKNTTIKFVALFCLAVLAGNKLSAQEVQFSQFYASSLYLNPAYAGMERDLAFSTNVRSQWSAAGNNNVTSQISAIIPYLSGVERKVQRGGIGISMFNDVAGAGSIKTTGFRGTLAYTSSFNNDMNKVSIGVQGGLTQSSLDINAKWPSQYNPISGGYDPSVPVNLTGGNTVKYYPVFNVGGIYSFNPSRNYYRSGTSAFVGASFSNLNRPNVSFFDANQVKGNLVSKVHGGLELHVNREFNFGPQLLIANQANFGTQVNVGVYCNYRLNERPYGVIGNTDLVLGLWKRLEDAYIVSVGLSNANYTVGFSYDATSSSLNTYNNGRGAYELSFSIRNSKDRRRRRFDTPRI